MYKIFSKKDLLLQFWFVLVTEAQMSLVPRSHGNLMSHELVQSCSMSIGTKPSLQVFSSKPALNCMMRTFKILPFCSDMCLWMMQGTWWMWLHAWCWEGLTRSYRWVFLSFKAISFPKWEILTNYNQIIPKHMPVLLTSSSKTGALFLLLSSELSKAKALISSPLLSVSLLHTADCKLLLRFLLK